MKQKAESDRELNENGNCCGVTQRENCGTKELCVPRSPDCSYVVVSFDQLCVKVAVSLTGPLIVIEAGLFVPEKEPVPVPVQLVKW